MRHIFLATVCTALFALSPAIAYVSDDVLQSLQRSFDNLHRSLQSKRGIAPDDKPTIDRLRQRFASFTAEHGERREAIAGELQLSIWLEDHDRVDSLFERLLNLDPEQLDIGHAWAGYFSRLNQRERVDAIYDTMLRLSPHSKDIRLTRAQRLRQQNNYARALEVLDELSPSDAEDPEVILLRSEFLFAEHRFEEAAAVLREIPEEVLRDQPRIRMQVEDVLPVRDEYIQLWSQERAIREAEATADLPRVEIAVADRGTIVLELFEDNAPNTVANFITLAEDGFYNETAFHRVIPGFMAEGGDPNTKPDATGMPGQGGPGYTIADEYGREDARKHFAGTLSMANTGSPNSAGSQFFITVQPVAHLNGGYTAFGRVLEGLDVVRAIEPDDRIESVRVLRKRDHSYEVAKITSSRAMDLPPDMPDDLRERVLRMLEEQEQQP